jgi:hypothetical protein
MGEIDWQSGLRPTLNVIGLVQQLTRAENLNVLPDGQVDGKDQGQSLFDLGA